MAIHQVVTLPHPVLRKKARKVTDFGSDLQTLVDDMIETMRQAPGVGLAAPQIGVQLQVVVVEYSEEEEEEKNPPKLYVIINPEITRMSREVELGTEGCLSVPEMLGDVERAVEITVRGVNRRGQPVKLKTSGWLARIFQHEIDHLNGILFVDRTEKVWTVEKETGQMLVDRV